MQGFLLGNNMAQTKTTALDFKSILKKAKDGYYKLPAFQRRWRWTSNQVISLYNSLRLSYPIGSFLFLTSDAGEKLGPRAFYGAGPRANANTEQESLVLDGQQRITAGLSICYGLDDGSGRDFFIDCTRIEHLLDSKGINIEDENQVKSFSLDIEVDDGYIVAKKTTQDKKSLFKKKGLLWTALLTEEKQDSLDEILDDTKEQRKKDIVRKVIRKHFKPNYGIQVPVIELGSEFDFASISKIFSTINSSGKPLTPFELVVAILYPNEIKLEDDIKDLKIKHPYYSNMDGNGEVLLQTIAIKSGRNPKKSLLPKNIDHIVYEKYADESAKALNDLGVFLTKQLGVGLDCTDKLVPYDAIFAPMAIALEQANKIQNVSEQSKAYGKLRRWFVSSAIGQRYQEGVHGKQESDLKDVTKWISEDVTPSWISDTYITPSVKNASPYGAIGKIFACILNAKNPKDPLKSEAIGFSPNSPLTQIHHIFPTRWVEKGIQNYSTEKFDPNIALNTMLLHQATNGDWLNFDPIIQVSQARDSNPHQYLNAFKNQLIDEEMLQILEMPSKNSHDFKRFIDMRYKAFVSELMNYGITEPNADIAQALENDAEELVEMDIPIED